MCHCTGYNPHDGTFTGLDVPGRERRWETRCSRMTYRWAVMSWTASLGVPGRPSAGTAAIRPPPSRCSTCRRTRPTWSKTPTRDCPSCARTGLATTRGWRSSPSWPGWTRCGPRRACVPRECCPPLTAAASCRSPIRPAASGATACASSTCPAASRPTATSRTSPRWARWQDGIGVGPAERAVLGRLDATLKARLAAYGSGQERYGLVHADTRLANLIVDDGTVSVIDFDDSGFSWFLYDVGTAVSFFEHEPHVPALIDSWLSGYRRAAQLPAADEAEIWTFILFRRLLLVAWIGSHTAVDIARELGAGYTRQSCDLAEAYLSRYGVNQPS